MTLLINLINFFWSMSNRYLSDNLFMKFFFFREVRKAIREFCLSMFSIANVFIVWHIIAFLLILQSSFLIFRFFFIFLHFLQKLFGFLLLMCLICFLVL